MDLPQPNVSKAAEPGALPRTLVDRAIRAALLDPALYRELKTDPSATWQGALVVLAAAVAAGVGTAGRIVLTGKPAGAPGAFMGTIAANVITWVLLTHLAYVLGTWVLRGQASYLQVLRALGFAYAPALIGVLTFIPTIVVVLGAAVGLWVFVSFLAAIRETNEFGSSRAVFTVVFSLVIYLLIRAPMRLILGV